YIGPHINEDQRNLAVTKVFEQRFFHAKRQDSPPAPPRSDLPPTAQSPRLPPRFARWGSAGGTRLIALDTVAVETFALRAISRISIGLHREKSQFYRCNFNIACGQAQEFRASIAANVFHPGRHDCSKPGRKSTLRIDPANQGPGFSSTQVISFCSGTTYAPRRDSKAVAEP